jgi:hypothetical protein
VVSYYHKYASRTRRSGAVNLVLPAFPTGWDREHDDRGALAVSGRRKPNQRDGQTRRDAGKLNATGPLDRVQSLQPKAEGDRSETVRGSKAVAVIAATALTVQHNFPGDLHPTDRTRATSADLQRGTLPNSWLQMPPRSAW